MEHSKGIRGGDSQLEQKSLDRYRQADETEMKGSLDSDCGKEDTFGRELEEAATGKEKRRKNYLE